LLNTRATRAIGFAFLCACHALPGCAVWPTMTRPTIQLSVRDEQGRPVEGATVHFATYSISFASRDSAENFETDANGAVAMDGKRERQFFFLAPDGGQFWSWSWCIDKPGFEPVLANDLRAGKAARTAAVVLLRTDGQRRCTWLQHPPMFEISGPTIGEGPR
jgi:hypothetical protein